LCYTIKTILRDYMHYKKTYTTLNLKNKFKENYVWISHTQNYLKKSENIL